MRLMIGLGLRGDAAKSQIYCHWKDKHEHRYGAHDDVEAQGLLSEIVDGGWLGRKPSVPTPAGVLRSLVP